MIVFDLSCDSGHHFEGWFGSSVDFADQQAKGLLCCPECGSADVVKAPMAPAVPKKGNQKSLRPAPVQQTTPQSSPETSPPQPMAAGQPSPEAMKALAKMAEMQAAALEKSTYVGEKFADKSRAMHYGEEDHAPIHGQASLKEAKELLDEGVPVAPLPFPVAKPDEIN